MSFRGWVIAGSLSIVLWALACTEEAAQQGETAPRKEPVSQEEATQRAETCMAAGVWRGAAQEWLFVANTPSGTYQEYFEELQKAFVPLGNTALPLASSDPESALLPLMRQWRVEVERWMSLLLRGSQSDREDARLTMNATVQDASALLVVECGLEPLLLYQARPGS